jgi:hypothetical protein
MPQARRQHLLSRALAAAYVSIPAATKASPAAGAAEANAAPASTNTKAPIPRARELVQASTAG